MWQTIVRCSRRFQTRSLFFCLIRWLPIMGQGSISSLTAPAMRPSIPSLMTSLSWEDSTFAVYRLENIFQWIHNYNTIRSILSSDFKWISYCISKRRHQIQEVSFKYIMSTLLGPKWPYCCSNMWHMLQITVTFKCACRQMCALELSLKFDCVLLPVNVHGSDQSHWVRCSYNGPW